MLKSTSFARNKVKWRVRRFQFLQHCRCSSTEAAHLEERKLSAAVAAASLVINEHLSKHIDENARNNPWSQLYGFRVNGERCHRRVDLHDALGEAKITLRAMEVQVLNAPYGNHLNTFRGQFNRPCGFLQSEKNSHPFYRLHIKQRANAQTETAKSDASSSPIEMEATVDPTGLLSYRILSPNVKLPTEMCNSSTSILSMDDESHACITVSRASEVEDDTAIRQDNFYITSRVNYGDVQRRIELENPEAMNPLLKGTVQKQTPVASALLDSSAIPPTRPGKVVVGFVFADDPEGSAGGVAVQATMNGKIVKVDVQEGSGVTKGQPVVVVEAMKMETILRSPSNGIVATVSVRVGETVCHNQSLLTIIPHDSPEA